MRWSFLIYGLSFAPLMSCLTLVAQDAPPNPVKKPGWVLDAHDEFDGPGLNTNLWIPHYLEWRTEKDRAAARYHFSNGFVTLFVDSNTPSYYKGSNSMTVSGIQTGDATGVHKESGGVHHEIPRRMKYAPRYGYFEIRAKLPARGMNAAFWTIGTKDEPSHVGEIDIFETVTTNSRVLRYVIHTWGDNRLTHKSLRPQPFFDTTAGFHIYGLEWNEEDCILYYDNHKITNMAQSPHYSSLFLLTLYGSTRDKERREFVIDYFRAYKKEGQPLTEGAGSLR